VDSFAEELIRRFSIDGALNVPIGTLSGGTVQKVILARELAGRADFIIFSEPTWGLDVSSSRFVYEKILELRKDGAAVVIFSSYIDEILGLSDTVAVMYRGRIVCHLVNDKRVNKELIGEYMLGLKDDFNAEDGEKPLA